MREEMGVGRPAPEIAPSGAPRYPGRDARGRFTKRNEHGLIYQPPAELAGPILREMRAALLTQKGLTEADVPPALSIIVDALAEAHVMRQSFFAYLARTGGAISPRGRTRRAVEGWSRACDRCAKLAAMIGLQRAPARVPTIAEWLAEGRDDEQSDADRDPSGPADSPE